DPEIKQLHNAVARYEDVGRLDVPVNDRVAVGELDGFADAAEQGQPAPEGETIVIAVFGDRHALHELEDEVRRAIGKGIGVEKPSDIGVGEAGEGSLLSFEPGAGLR